MARLVTSCTENQQQQHPTVCWFCHLLVSVATSVLNPFTADPVKALHLAMMV